MLKFLLKLLAWVGAIAAALAALAYFDRAKANDYIDWCAEGTVPANVLRSAFGCVPQAGGFWPGNVFLYDTAAPGFGAAFPCPDGPGGWQPGFEPFVIVPY